MRRVLLRWLVQVGRKFQVQAETLHICVQLVDYVLVFDSARIHRGNFQLLGIAALFVASKYNEIHTYEADKYVYVCDGLYSLAQLFEMEGVILTATSFNLQFPTLHQFTALALAPHGEEVSATVAQLSSLVLFDFALCNRFQKQHLASVVVYFALKLQDPTQIKSKEVMESSQVPEEVFRECFMLLVALYRDRQDLK